MSNIPVYNVFLFKIQNTNAIRKTEDILLSSTIAGVPVSSSINMPASDLILQPPVCARDWNIIDSPFLFKIHRVNLVRYLHFLQLF